MKIKQNRSSAIIYSSDHGYLILQKQSEKKGKYYQILSGGVEKNESFLETIVREVNEELSLRIEEKRFHLKHTTPERYIYFLELDKNEVESIQLSDEHISYSFVKSYQELSKQVVKQNSGKVAQILDSIFTC